MTIIDGDERAATRTPLLVIANGPIIITSFDY